MTSESESYNSTNVRILDLINFNITVNCCLLYWWI